MDYIVEFYKGLDSINLLLFWGVIIVITLLLIFSIIMINKNRELKRLIKEKQIANVTNDIPIKQYKEKSPEPVVEENKAVIEKEDSQEAHITNDEKPFIAEEYVINYNNKSDVASKDEEVTPADINNVSKTSSENVMVRGPYQRNVLREMSSNQTSPIGIITKRDATNIDYEKARELRQSLSIDNTIASSPKEPSKMVNNSSLNEMTKKIDNNQTYLNEVSNKINEVINNSGRTEYEIKQENDAIISYEELMKKKDTIKTIDEEEAVISIEELYQKEKSKLYGITEEEENKEFIDELKNFRDNL